MFKITIIGIDGRLLTTVKKVGEIRCIDQHRRVFTATFDDCIVKVMDNFIRIKNPKKRAFVRLLNYEFEEIRIT